MTDEDLARGAISLGRYIRRGARGPIPKEAHPFLDAMEDWLIARKDARLVEHPNGDRSVSDMLGAAREFAHYKALQQEMAADKAYRA